MTTQEQKCASCDTVLPTEEQEGYDDIRKCEICGDAVCSIDELNDHGGTLECNECEEYARYEDCAHCKNEVSCEFEDYQKIDGLIFHVSCAKDYLTCDRCEARVESRDELAHISFSEWDNNYKKTYDYYVCSDCDYSIDPQAIAESMTNDEGQQQEIVEAINSNIDTNGEIWKQLKNADIEDRWNIIAVMGIARDRHENTDYDELLASGMSRDLARELKS